jgi:hypothetical protein
MGASIRSQSYQHQQLSGRTARSDALVETAGAQTNLYLGNATSISKGPSIYGQCDRKYYVPRSARSCLRLRNRILRQSGCRLVEGTTLHTLSGVMGCDVEVQGM